MDFNVASGPVLTTEWPQFSRPSLINLWTAPEIPDSAFVVVSIRICGNIRAFRRSLRCIFRLSTFCRAILRNMFLTVFIVTFNSVNLSNGGMSSGVDSASLRIACFSHGDEVLFVCWTECTGIDAINLTAYEVRRVVG